MSFIHEEVCENKKSSRKGNFLALGTEEENVIPVEPFGDVSFRKLKNILMVELKNIFT